MAALVSDDRFQAEVVWITVAFEYFGVHDEQIEIRCGSHAELRAAALAVNMAILDTSVKPKRTREASHSRTPPHGVTPANWWRFALSHIGSISRLTTAARRGETEALAQSASP